MNTQNGNRGLIIGIAVVGVLCVGGMCLAGGVPAGVLAVRQAIDLQRTEGSTESTATLNMNYEATASPEFSETERPSPDASETQYQTPFGTITMAPEAATAGATQQLEDSQTAPPSTAVPAPAATEASGASASPMAVMLDAWCIPWNSPTKKADVLEVIDGVTIEVRVDGEVQQIRYIGIDLLAFGDDASVWSAMTEKNRSLVEGKQLLLIEGATGGDIEAEDGPLLRYVIAENTFINLEMVESGYAVAKSTPPHTSCDAVFEEAETEAILAGRGLWAPEPTSTRTLRPPTATASPIGAVVVVKVESRGTIWQEPEEYVEIFNSGVEAVQLAGWSVSDIQNHIFVFPNFVLKPGEYCRVTTNEYRPQNCGFSYYRPSPIWDNTGDCAYLKDANGRLVDEFCYD